MPIINGPVYIAISNSRSTANKLVPVNDTLRQELNNFSKSCCANLQESSGEDAQSSWRNPLSLFDGSNQLRKILARVIVLIICASKLTNALG